MKTMLHKQRLCMLLIGCIYSLNLVCGQDYLISFGGNGTVDSVFVENTSKGTEVKLAGDETLRLSKVFTGIEVVTVDDTETLRVSPNPVYDGNCRLSLHIPADEHAVISICDITGKVLVNQSLLLERGENTLSLSNIGQGIFLVKLVTSGRTYSARIISRSLSLGGIEVKNSLSSGTYNNKSGNTGLSKVKNNSSEVKTMTFSEGEFIRIIGRSDGKKVLHMLEPTKDETVNFEFQACADGEGTQYPVVKIGNQLWMAENLKTTKYNDGTAIKEEKDNEAWDTSSEGLYCWYNNDIGNKNPYGALYNWAAVNSGKLAPKGWHVATKDDWFEMLDGLEYMDIGVIKEPGNAHWISNTSIVTNSTGFTAVPNGMRYTDSELSFEGLGTVAFWWTSSINDGPPPSVSRPKSDNLIKMQPYTTAYSIYVQHYYTSNIHEFNSGIGVRCVKNTAPKVKTGTIFITGANTAKCEIDAYKDGGEELTMRGICWSSETNEPTINHNIASATAELGKTIMTMTPLEVNKVYYARAYAANPQGITYGETRTFTTYEPEIVADIDGNVYKTQKIGNQLWMKEDLRVSKFNNGQPIDLLSDKSKWVDLSVPAYCMYNDVTPEAGYGYLYNYRAVQSDMLAPEGWHVPTFTEWEVLVDTLNTEGYDLVAGGKMKEEGTSHWFEPNVGASNLSGFTALPGGMRLTNGEYYEKGIRNIWWTTTEYVSGDIYQRVAVLSYDETANSWALSSGKYGYSVRCLKDYPAKVTTYIKNVTQTSAIFGVDVYEGGGPVKRKGICWSATDTEPDIINATVIDLTAGYGTEWRDNTELQPGVTYYVRAFAENSTGISYGNTITFSTKSSETVKDIDGNEYHTIKIGTQTWMVENLKTTRYNDGMAIPVISGYFYETPGYSTYGNDTYNKNTYGLLYNWYAVNTGKLAPEGWRIPKEEDWVTLVNYLGGYAVAGGKLKEAGTLHWYSPNGGAQDYGFTALPGGRRDGPSAYFLHLRFGGYWWSTDEGWAEDSGSGFQLDYYGENAGLYIDIKSTALSVRCIKE